MLVLAGLWGHICHPHSVSTAVWNCYGSSNSDHHFSQAGCTGNLVFHTQSTIAVISGQKVSCWNWSAVACLREGGGACKQKRMEFHVLLTPCNDMLHSPGIGSAPAALYFPLAGWSKLMFGGN